MKLELIALAILSLEKNLEKVNQFNSILFYLYQNYLRLAEMLIKKISYVSNDNVNISRNGSNL